MYSTTRIQSYIHIKETPIVRSKNEPMIKMKRRKRKKVVRSKKKKGACLLDIIFCTIWRVSIKNWYAFS